MPANPNFSEVGAAWWSEKFSNALSLKLENGMYITLFPNEGSEGTSKPAFRASMKKEDAEALGIAKAPYNDPNR